MSTFGLLLILPLACDDTAVAPVGVPPTPEASRKTTFTTLAALGSHRLEARSKVTVTPGEGPARVEDEAYSLRWRDADHWQAIRRRGDRVSQEVRVWDGVAWLATGGGMLERRGDAEPYRADLSLSWDPWQQALGTWAEYVGFRELGQEVVESRRARVFAVEALPGGPGASTSRELVSVEGKVWIDEATAVRLVGDVRMQVRHRQEERSIELRFALSDIGGESGVEPPPEAAKP